MKKLLYTFLAVSIIFSACEEEDTAPANTNNNSGNAQLFRALYDQTDWYSSNLGDNIIKFSTQNLFSQSSVSTGFCKTYEEITFSNVYRDGCTYPQASLSLVSETSTHLVFRESITSGQGSSCLGGITNITFEAISSTEIKLSFTDIDGNLFQADLFPSNQTFSSSNCDNIWWDWFMFMG
jgi:hypothetical protein